MNKWALQNLSVENKSCFNIVGNSVPG